MRIAFIDWIQHGDYHVGSIDQLPMGGTQSAAIYLARELARQNHDVFFITRTTQPGRYAGVECLSVSSLNKEVVRDLRLDAFIVMQRTISSEPLRRELDPSVRMVLWSQDTENQKTVEALAQPGERDAYDGFAMVSQWQLGKFAEKFQLPAARMAVMRNAMAPAFQAAFAEGESILAAKEQPPILAYTSTPFRGLEMLLELFPRIRQRIPGVRLQVFSSMQVYLVTAADDTARFGALYERCRTTPGVEYFGSIPQPELARRLRKVSVLAYPNIYEETACIAAVEAMASGCAVVTSALGALPETTAGFARLCSVEQDREAYIRQFVESVVAALEEQTGPAAAEVEAQRRRQVAHANQLYSWQHWAKEWVAWLKRLPTRKM